MTNKRAPDGSKRGGFLSKGFRELGRKLERSRLRRAMREQEAERAKALADLGRRAWEERIDLTAFAEQRDQLAALDARAAELSQAADTLEKERAALELGLRGELEKSGARRKAVQDEKGVVDAALQAARSRKTACEQAIRDAESRSVSEQGDLAARLTAARADLPGLVAEEDRLAGESQRRAAEIAAIDAEERATRARFDTGLGRVRSESQGASQQASAVQRERADSFRSLGFALYESPVRSPAIEEHALRVTAVDRARTETEAALETSFAETRSLPRGTMLKLWSVLVGVPLLLTGVGIAIHHYATRRAAPVAAPTRTPAAHVPARAPAAPAPVGRCEYRSPPDHGEGVAVMSDCTRAEGTFVERRLHGKGRKTWPNGERMEGQFYSDVLDGQGVRVYRDGRRFEGTFSLGRPIGHGKLTLPDGTVYEGRFWGPSLLGFGVRRSPSGEVLAGDWRGTSRGRMQPFGEMLRVRADGTREKIDAATLDPTKARPAGGRPQTGSPVPPSGAAKESPY